MARSLDQVIARLPEKRRAKIEQRANELATLKVYDEPRTCIRTLFSELANDAGAANPEYLAQQLGLLYDGASVSAQMDRDPRLR